ncbi:MAG: hypothetical protein K9N11_05440 [Lentisphaeria bacterium]|nr:hypothetical protein [Candidatus Neomarinimicrobiota bacterium]MCF7842275.1 hypothetical protein [Lentisphaeria bacterium]
MRLRNVLPLLLLSLLFWQCDRIDQTTGVSEGEETCESCHTNQLLLTSLATTAGNSDAAGHLAPLSAVQRVHIRLDAGEESFADVDSIHARVTCSGCHRGVNPVSEENEQKALAAAHKGLVSDPSRDSDIGCGGALCHSDIVRKHATSIHRQSWGAKWDLAIRFGGPGSTVADLPPGVAENFESVQLLEIATCGECHVSRPDRLKGGFAGNATGGNHKFIRHPDVENTCTACHSNTIGAEWRGEVTGTNPDVHANFGFTCTTCHTEDLHGNGEIDREITSVYDVVGIASCYSPCHSNDADDNLFHQVHWAESDNSMKSVSCFVCHSQNLNHFEGGYPENTDLVYADFKVGLNPGYQNGGTPHENEKWQVVRHTPVPRTITRDDWGVALEYFDELPTYKRASPHNIQRWTIRTLVDSTWLAGGNYDAEQCYENCHLHGVSEDGTIAGPLQTFYLMSDYLEERGQSDEILANERVTVDENGQLFPGGCDTCHGG